MDHRLENVLMKSVANAKFIILFFAGSHQLLHFHSSILIMQMRFALVILLSIASHANAMTMSLLTLSLQTPRFGIEVLGIFVAPEPSHLSFHITSLVIILNNITGFIK